MIDPGIWSDPTIGELTIHARLLFIGMVSLADDEGRIDLNVRYLRKEIFGYDDLSVAEVASFLDEIIAQCKNLQSYWVDNRQYGVFLTWREYQKIDRAYRSRLPDPPAYMPAAGLIEWSPLRHKAKSKEERAIDEHSTNDRRSVHEHSTSVPSLKELNLTELKGKELNGTGSRAVKPEPAAAGGSDQNGTKEPEPEPLHIPEELMAAARAAGRKHKH
jgi:hypothetical protein